MKLNTDLSKVAIITDNPAKANIPNNNWDVPTWDVWLKMAEHEPRWLVERFIPHHGITLISGQQKKTNKTFFANVLALAVASGKDIGGIKPVAPCNVLYVEEEGHIEGVRNTMQALCRGYGLDCRDYPDLQNVYYAFRNRVKLDLPVWRKHIIEKVKEKNIGLVIFDAITYMHEGDENKTSDMVKVADTIQTVRASGCSVVVIAHLDKARGDNTKADHDSQIRGSSVVVNAYDLHLAFRRYKWTTPHISCYSYNRHGKNRLYRIEWDKVSEPYPNDDVLLTLKVNIEEIQEQVNNIIPTNLKPRFTERE